MVDPVRRTRPPETGGEIETMTGLLDFLRTTVVNKVAGLTDEQAFSRPVPSSALTPAGVVKHLTATERFWFSIDFGGLEVPWPYTEDDPHGGFPIDEGDTIAAVVAAYVEENARGREVIAGHAPEDRAQGEDMAFHLRYLLAHLVEETARHCGHLDLMREAIDGEVGE